MRNPAHDPRVAMIDDESSFGAALAPWMTGAAQEEAIRRTGHRLVDAWEAAMVAGDDDEVDRLVRRSRAVTDAHRQLSLREHLLG